jgi:type I restriction enzyme, S subunit
MSDGWRSVRLGAVTEQVRRECPVEADQTYDLLGVRWYGQGVFLRETLKGQDIKATRLYQVKAGDFIYNRLFAWKGSFAVVPDGLDGGYVSAEFPVFDVDPSSAQPEFINLVMCQPASWTIIERQSAGSTAVSRNRWREERFNDWELWLPPLIQQRQIVDLMSTVDSAADGARLVASSTTLLSETLENEAMDATKNGQFVELGQIAEVVGGITKDAKRQNDPTFVTIPYLRVANVQRGRLDLSEMSEIRASPTKAQGLCVQAGDVLLNEGGDRDKLGRGWVWEGQIANCIHQNHVFRARIIDQRFDPYYVAIVANSRPGQRWFEENGSQTTNLASISLSTLRRFPVPELDAVSQAALIRLVLACREQVLAAEREGKALSSVRGVLLAKLLSGDHEIPHTYDSLLTA